MAYGLTLEGFVSKTLLEIKKSLEDSLKADFGIQINLQAESVFGQQVGIISERLSLVWELAEAIYYSQYPDSAEGSSFDNVLSLVGLRRLDAKFSKITDQLLFGTSGTVVLKNTGLSVDGSPTIKFETDEDITLVAGTDEIQNLAFSGTPSSGSFKLKYDEEITDAINWDDSAGDIEMALNALSGLSEVEVTGSFAADFVVTFAGDDGKQAQILLEDDSNTLSDGGAVTITITVTTPGVPQGIVSCTCTVTGSISVVSKTLTVIDNPIGGLTRVFNVSAATLGRNLETDTEGKIRRGNRLQISEAGPKEAIRTAIEQLNDDSTKTQLDAVLLFENVTLVVDSRGIPGKAFEAYIYQNGGATDRDQEIAQAIFDSKPAGIEPYGDIEKTITDVEGFSHAVKFSRPTTVDIYLELDLTVNSDYPAGGDAQVVDIMVTWGNGLGVGQDVIVYPALVSQLNTIKGITDVVVRIGEAASPTEDDNIVIDDGVTPGVIVELSMWDASRIIITS